MKKYTLFLLIFSFCALILPQVIHAENSTEFYLDKNTLKNGYTLSFDDNNFKLAIWPNALKQSSTFKIYKDKSLVNAPKSYRLLSDLYKIRCPKEKCGELKKELTITLNYQNPGFNNKFIMYYKPKTKTWNKLGTKIDEPGLVAEANLNRKNVRQIAVFEKVLKPKRHRIASSTQSVSKKLKLGKQFHLKLKPASFSSQVDIRIKQINQNNYPDLPEENILSNLFHYKVIEGKNPKKPIIFKVRSKKYTENPVKLKKYTKKKGWQDLDTTYNSDKMLAKTSHQGKKGIFALFENREFQIGGASWYNWHGAASNDYPMGTELKVTNLANNKSCIVTVVSTGPFTPGLIIDLPLSSFDEIGNPDTGIIQVRVEKI